MKRLLIAVLCLLTFNASAQDKKNEAFEKLKGLAGTWETAEKGGMTFSYRVTSGGSTVMETIGAGSEHEMVTMYYLDGDDLVLTHYCMLGNQPHMKAEKEMKGNAVTFVCDGKGANVKCATDPHMHQLVLTFTDKDAIKAEWSMYEGGKAGKTAVFDLKRKKE